MVRMETSPLVQVSVQWLVSKVTLIALTDHSGSPDAEPLAQWLSCADELRQIWQTADPNDCPFAYNETASMSFLCCAAGRAGWLAMADYAVDKTLGSGRCDLWLSNDTDEWALEFKQYAPSWPAESQVARRWNEAISCTNDLVIDASIQRYAGLVSSDFNFEDPSDAAAWLKFQRTFAEANATFAWQLQSESQTKAMSTIIMLKSFQ